MDFMTGFDAELWFRLTCRRLRMLDPNPPTLRMLEPALRTHLPKKTERAIHHMSDESDLELWLDLVLKIDSLLSLQDLDGKALRIGADVTLSPSEVVSKFAAIRSMPFQAIRRELNIDKHWVVLVSASALPSDATLIDTFYEIVDHPDECSNIDLSP
jgi:hypothetical protein